VRSSGVDDFRSHVPIWNFKESWIVAVSESLAVDHDKYKGSPYHDSRYQGGAAKLRLPKGRSVLTVRILSEGNMNLAYFDFKRTG
jgi:hypothetical protein